LQRFRLHSVAIKIYTSLVAGLTSHRSAFVVQPKICVTAVGEEGTLEVSRGGWATKPGQRLLAKFSEAGAKAAGVGVDVDETFLFTSMDEEMKAFLQAVAVHKSGAGRVELGLGDPVEGFVDLAMICALMESGRTQQLVQIASVSSA
jgi:hypothetical protein